MWRWIAGSVVMATTAIVSPSAKAMNSVSGGTPEYFLNVPPTHRIDPWQTMWLLARQRLQELRCLIPQASLKGTFQEPKAEVCYRRFGMRICASSRLSMSAGNYSAGFFITNRPGDCPF